jgi:two-component system invasion response regulator UvrY
MKGIIIADDHSIVRIGTALMIKEILGEQIIVDEAVNFQEALDKLKRNDYSLIFLDINIPGGNNLEMIKSIRERDEFIKILVFTSYDEAIFAARYIKAGAHGYLSKESSEEEFKEALLAVLNGHIYRSPSLKEHISEDGNNKQDDASLNSLSNREMEVANLLTKGQSTTEIARTLNIKLNTVSTYKAHIYTKLEVNNVVDLIEKIKLLKDQ